MKMKTAFLIAVALGAVLFGAHLWASGIPNSFAAVAAAAAGALYLDSGWRSPDTGMPPGIPVQV